MSALEQVQEIKELARQYREVASTGGPDAFKSLSAISVRISNIVDDLVPGLSDTQLSQVLTILLLVE